MYEEAIDFIQRNVPPFQDSINGIRNVPEIIAHYEAQGFICTILPDDIHGIRILFVS